MSNLDSLTITNVKYEFNSNGSAQVFINWSITSNNNLNLTRYKVKLLNDSSKYDGQEWPGRPIKFLNKCIYLSLISFLAQFETIFKEGRGASLFFKEMSTFSCFNLCINNETCVSATSRMPNLYQGCYLKPELPLGTDVLRPDLQIIIIKGIYLYEELSKLIVIN